MKRILPWLLVAFFGSEVVMVMLPKKDGEFRVRDFGRLPVLLNGRVQPFDSVARNSLLQIRSTASVPLEGNGADGTWGEWDDLRKNPRSLPLHERNWWQFNRHPKKLKPTEWLLELATRPEIADTRPVFLIHHSELLSELKLQDSGIANSALRYYSFQELESAVNEIGEQAGRVMKREEDKLSTPEQRTVFEKQMMKLYNAVVLYQRLKVTLQPQSADNFPGELTEFQKSLGPAKAAAQASQGSKEFDQAAIERIAGPLKEFQLMARYGYALVVPPLQPEVSPDAWQNVGSSLMESARDGEFHPAVLCFARMGAAYRAKQAADFNQALTDYQQWLTPKFQKASSKGRVEFYFNDMKPFLHAMIIYIFAFILSGGVLLTLSLAPGLSESFRRSAFWLIVLAGVVHTFGLVFRMVLEGRPPVTNLYSSAIFIGWGAVVLGLILEAIYKVGIGNLVAALAGFVTLIIAHNLALSGDTMEMLRAVLDTNFWLATHVVVVTLGYASTFVAGLLAIIFVVTGVFTPLLSQKLRPQTAANGKAGAKSARPAPAAAATAGMEVGKALSKMVYGIVCFATLFSFTGTVLGGIWADQSWGRFWGWDPKENGALLIVIWNAIILHARWGGLVRDRGIMNLAVFGNVVTSFSWFGVNMLGIGLHSYGFMDAAFKWLMLFVSTQVVVIGLGLLPLRLWRSFRQTIPVPAKGPVKATEGPATAPATV